MKLSKVLKFVNSFVPKAKNMVVFVDGRMYKDSIEALKKQYEAIVGSKYKTYILYTSKDHYNNSKENRKFYYPSVMGLFILLRSKFIITDIVIGDSFLSSKQIIFNIWHGIGLKKILGFTDEHSNRKKGFAHYAVAYSDYFVETVSKAFIIPKENVLISGSPRNDYFYMGKRSDLSFIIPDYREYKQVIIWMPTYRQSTSAHSKNDGGISEYGIPIINSNNIMELNQVLKNNKQYLVIKHHVLQNSNKQIQGTLSNIKVVLSSDFVGTDMPLYQFIGQCDALISDYSSIYLEYLSLNKPICFAYDDFSEYEAKRGFMFQNPKEMMPGLHVTDFDSLIYFFNQLSRNKDEYYLDRKNAIRNMGLHSNKNNSKDLASQIYNKVKDVLNE